nr:hypothetical protein [Tanacetum cinerariifolium]
LIRPDDIKQEILKRDEDVEDPVAQEREQHERRRHHGVHEVVVGSRNNRDQNEGRVSKANEEIEYLPEYGLARLALLKCSAEEPGVVDHGRANAERVPKVHRWH